jgi:8-oxo-dGTP pyrophosphatase MutT (NUDIX family)
VITFPGGGVEVGDTHEESVINECLEEIGVLVSGVESLGVKTVTEAAVNKTARAGMYSDIETHYYRADYSRVDKSILGRDDDAMSFEWVSLSKAIEMVKNGPHSVFSEGRLLALGALKMSMSKK